MRRLLRELPLALFDAGVIVVAYLVALIIRFEGGVELESWQRFWGFVPIVVLLHLSSNLAYGLYGHVWRYASVQEARRIVNASLTAALLVLGAELIGEELMSGRDRIVPLSVIALGTTLTIAGFGAMRFQGRLFARRQRKGRESARRILIVGAGDAGAMVLRDIRRNPTLSIRPVAVVDDDQRKRGRKVHGVSVVGATQSIPEVVARLKVQEVLLAIPSATSELVRSVAEYCERADVSMRVLPSLREIVGGKVTARDIRDLTIEDLLGRQQVTTDLETVRAVLQGKRILVTGSGGSIGSEIARQVSTFEPARLFLLDHDETHLHEICTVVPAAEAILCDIQDRARLVALFERSRPEVVFHAAAHKHVPILESHPEEAFSTNVLGTQNVVHAAAVAGASRFVLVSTDKAVKPSSVMGASKRLAEQIIWSLGESGCVFCSVRFANVLGSRGSVIPTFLQQISLGGPVTVTHDSMTRYFMSLDEAVQLVLQASAMAQGGEVFTLNMGEPINILDLARRIIRLSGRTPGIDIPIELSGVRPGEKLTEDLLDESEHPTPSLHPSILISHPSRPDPAALEYAIRELKLSAEDGRSNELAARMKFLASSPARGLVSPTDSVLIAHPVEEPYGTD